MKKNIFLIENIFKGFLKTEIVLKIIVLLEKHNWERSYIFCYCFYHDFGWYSS
jgi:hypothetical protein